MGGGEQRCQKADAAMYVPARCYGTAPDCVYTVYMSVDGGKNKQRAGEGGV